MIRLFVGMTTWDDVEFLKRSIQALQVTLEGVEYQIMVWDNASTDGTCALLRTLGIPFVSKRVSQGDALNSLLALSCAPYTLLLHSDVVMLSRQWFPVLSDEMQRTGAVLISPEDVGLGNMHRRQFRGMPESSFMFFDTPKVRRCLRFSLKRSFISIARSRHYTPLRRFNFYGPHVTHEVPELLHKHGLDWLPMTPLTSRRLSRPWFRPEVQVANWEEKQMYEDDLYYDYGFGNFYEFHGIITHYHNWYGRFAKPSGEGVEDPESVTAIRRAFCRGYMTRFLADFDAGNVRFPDSVIAES